MEHLPNALIHASSPYLLQHAYNPVQWQEWGVKALQQAKDEQKLILVSIGYSACHWCHVMEHESFEDFEVAEVMNQHFVCIKIDREERPDIDQIYMLAVQLMGVNGGWPLNCICLPDQRPIYGGTYFKKNDWINILENVAAYWKNEPDNALDYASRLATGIAQAEKIFPAVKKDYDQSDLTAITDPWKRTFDMNEGGYNRSPKFPLPNNWLFLMKAGYLMEDQSLITATLFTLEKMAMGGIYDQIGGGFARYSVDDRWHVPHFEKMLYDNAQLIELYTEGYQFTKFELFKTVVKETIQWADREMTSAEGLFYSALDADSEGIEGKFYVWDIEEIRQSLKKDAELFIEYYNVTTTGNWEEEHTNILLRRIEDEHFAEKHKITIERLQLQLEDAKQILLAERSNRVRPGLDDKCLTAWNGMMIKALAKAAHIFNDNSYYEKAAKAAKFILSNMKTEEGGLFRNYKNGKGSITAFLDDYAFLIDALIALYQYNFEEFWLNEAKQLTDFVLDHFADENSPMLFYTSASGEQLIARKHEVMDNVIPSSNSAMAQNLHTLGLLFNLPHYQEKASDMLASVQENIKKYGSAYSNWATQLLNEVYGINEVVLMGDQHAVLNQELNQFYIPNKIVMGGTKGTLPLLENKGGSETKIYICKDKTCSLPVGSVREALGLIN